MPYDNQLEIMRRAIAMPYGGTWPASYTLSFVEALMMGLPIVSISKTLAHIPKYEPIDFFEADEILAEVGGLVADTPEQMIHQVKKLLSDKEHAANISEKQRKLAIKMFGKKAIAEKWRAFL